MTQESVDTCDLLCLDLPHAETIRTALPEVTAVDRAAAGARALGDPTRLRVATALLSGEELCVCDLAWVVGLAQNLVSHHLRLLKGAGLVTGRRHGRLVMYALTPSGHALVTAVLAIACVSVPATTTSSAAATVQGRAHG
ncbi:metalloregulator ArsR/SmtB family transcription factor [Gordonia sp. JH63]|uniref:Regulatory protein, arsR family n=1 Tax=Gordonia westfalica TaxID=158898 RepID=Q70K54_9ACTN|nr:MULTISPECIES: metalloregulator ArsR/SmtB family transcription factor [Gordonia]MCT1352482.1 metalloregulator ArsR/SmtB family transcription factor [Gordonia sp. p3-SID1431]QHD86151.1 metalloregulator ArsR/SmtB family transcription factor [Gordonia sp. JH63]WGJ83774.1 metalloregulator ArsR/SmtB family transcription factor [Gordonia sp. SMJS1]CAE09095.1 putative CadC protein [Gordonia westfalica]SDT91930.1 regulatory protein, arsR family [Gordonia westfalica]